MTSNRYSFFSPPSDSLSDRSCMKERKSEGRSKEVCAHNALLPDGIETPAVHSRLYPNTTTSTSSSPSPSSYLESPSSSCSVDTITPASSITRRASSSLLDDVLPAKFALRIPPSSTSPSLKSDQASAAAPPSLTRSLSDASSPLQSSTSNKVASSLLARRFSHDRRPSLEEVDPVAARSYARGLATHHKEKKTCLVAQGGRGGCTPRRVSPLADRPSSGYLTSSESISSITSSNSQALSTSSSATSVDSIPHPTPKASPVPLESDGFHAVLRVKRKRDILPTILFILYLRLQTMKSSLAFLVSSDFLLDAIFPASHPSHAYDDPFHSKETTISRGRRSRRGDEVGATSTLQLKAMLVATIMLSYRSVLGSAIGFDFAGIRDVTGAGAGRSLFASEMLFRVASSFLGVSYLNLAG